MEREASDIRSSSSSGAGEAEEEEKHSCCICNNAFKTKKALYGHMRTHPKSSRGVKPPPAAGQQGRNVRESAAAAEESIPVRGKLVPVDQRAEEDVNLWRWESVVNQLLLLVENSPLWPQGDDGGSSENKITSDGSIAGGGSGGNREVVSVVAAGAEAGVGAEVAVNAIIAAHNGTVSDVKKRGSSSSSSSAAGGSGAHTCDKCGMTFETGQSLGGHMRKHYEGPPIIVNKKRTREQREETSAPTVERRAREPAVPTGHTVALMAAVEVRMESHFDAPLESHNPALLSQSVRARDGGDCERSSAGHGARRLLDLDLNKLPEPEEEEPKHAPQPESERRDNDALVSLRLGHELAEPKEEPKNAPQPEPERKDDDALLSLRLGGQFDFR